MNKIQKNCEISPECQQAAELIRKILACQTGKIVLTINIGYWLNQIRFSLNECWTQLGFPSGDAGFFPYIRENVGYGPGWTRQLMRLSAGIERCRQVVPGFNRSRLSCLHRRDDLVLVGTTLESVPDSKLEDVLLAAETHNADPVHLKQALSEIKDPDRPAKPAHSSVPKRWHSEHDGIVVQGASDRDVEQLAAATGLQPVHLSETRVKLKPNRTCTRTECPPSPANQHAWWPVYEAWCENIAKPVAKFKPPLSEFLDWVWGILQNYRGPSDANGLGVQTPTKEIIRMAGGGQ